MEGGVGHMGGLTNPRPPLPRKRAPLQKKPYRSCTKFKNLGQNLVKTRQKRPMFGRDLSKEKEWTTVNTLFPTPPLQGDK